jgi:hypothetical protein
MSGARRSYCTTSSFHAVMGVGWSLLRHLLLEPAVVARCSPRPVFVGSSLWRRPAGNVDKDGCMDLEVRTRATMPARNADGA